MIKLLLILFIISISYNKVYSQDLSIEDKNLKDSLFSIINSEPYDSLKYETALRFYRTFFYKSFSREFIDYVVENAVNQNNYNFQIEAYNAIARKTLELYGVTKEFEFWVNKIKEVNQSEGDFYSYFALRETEICWYIEKGKYEFTLDKIDSLSIEAENLKSERGKVICKLLLSSLYYIKQQDDKLLENNIELLKMEGLNFRERLLAILQIISSFSATKKYEEALFYSDMAIKELDENVSTYNNYAINRINYLTVEFLYCSIYREIPNAEKLKLHIDKANKLLKDEDGYLNKSKYYHNLASYQYLIKEYRESINSYNKSIEYRKLVSTNPVNINKLNIYKSLSMGRNGDIDEAYDLIKKSVYINDSIYNSILSNQEKIMSQNYRMEMANIKAEKIKNYFNLSFLIAGLIISLIISYFIIRMIYINKRLNASKKEIYNNYLMTKQADKQKELFVSNINKEIKEPLNNIITITSELSSGNNDYTHDEIYNRSLELKESSSKLIFLVNNILDLSRLESGMMKFSFENINIESFIRTLIQNNYNLDDNSNLDITFKAEQLDLSYKADHARLEKLIDSYINTCISVNGHKSIELNLKRSENKSAVINIKGSSLADKANKDIEVAILKNINNIVLNKFGWKEESVNKEEVNIFIN